MISLRAPLVQTSSTSKRVAGSSLVLQRKCSCGGTAGPTGECEECRKKKLQRTVDAVQSGPEPSNNTYDAGSSISRSVQEALSSPGAPLDSSTREFMESRFGHNFSRVRVHTDQRAADSARAVNASAYTLGQDIVFGQGAFTPGRSESGQLLAHELTHTLQQGPTSLGPGEALEVGDPGDALEREAERIAGSVTSGSNGLPELTLGLATGSRHIIQRDVKAPMDDPARFQKVNQSLFVPPPSPPGTATAAGTSAPAFDAAAQASVKKQFTDAMKDLESKNPAAFAHDLPENTTQNDAEKSTVAMDQQIRKKFPQIASPLPQATLTSSVHVMTDTKTSSDDYLRGWLAERLQGTDMSKYRLNETSKPYQDFLTDLLGDSYLGSRIRELGRHKGAFTETTPTSRDVYLNRGLTTEQRETSLLHELVHFYTHPSFRAWVDSTLDPRLYDEGFTEYLSRKAMTPDQLKNNSGQYQSRVDRIDSEVAKYIPEDDIARAFFAGEVWRIEGKSQVAKKTFKEQTGLDPNAKPAEENKESRDTAGIVETVAPGERYRFMNLGNEVADPKPEHVTFFNQILQQFVQKDTTARLRFVGHASSPGTLSFNDALSLQRAKAFYKMARDAGVQDSQLVDADKPPHFGETNSTAGNEDVQGRAFNRRVELFIAHAAAVPGTVTPQKTGASANELEKPGEGMLQRKPAGVEGSSPVEAPASVDDVLRSGGRPLDASTRAFAEPRFGHDFSRVKIHTDSRAAESARAVNSFAYTVGQDIVFASGQYAPQSAEGRWLLGHELAHVVQQEQMHSSNDGRQVSQPNHASEVEADRIADSISSDLNPAPLRAQERIRPQLSRKVAAGKVNCTAGTAGAPADPVKELTGVEGHAQGLATATAVVTQLESARKILGLTGPKSDVRLAYEEFFGLPPAAKGGFMNRLTGTVVTDQEDAVAGELDLFSNRLQLIADNFDNEIHYGCLGAAGAFRGCTADCTFDAYACHGNPAIILCSTFWPLSERGKTTLLIHEASHMLWNNVNHNGGYRDASCYANYVARIFNAPLTGPACPHP